MDVNKHFSLIKDADDHFHIHDSRDNTHFKLAKKPLHPATQLKVMKLKKFSEGGDVEGEDGSNEAESDSSETPTQDAPEETPVAASAEAPSAVGTAPQFGMDALAPAAQAPAGWQAPMLPPGQAPAPEGSGEIPVAGPPSAGGAAPNKFAMPGSDEMYKGVQAQAGAQMQMAKAQEQALRQYQDQQAVHQLNYEKNLADINQEQAGLQKQLADGKIDPKRYFKNMDTGSRISTAIGLILGGIGSGLTHGPNVALQLMDKAVDKDIEAQKADLGKTHSLLSLNMQKYHNLQTAEAATRLQYNTVLQTQLQVAQSKATNGLAASALHMQLGKLQQQDAIYKQQIALATTKASALGAGTGEGGISLGHEPGLLLNDPKYRETRVEVNGKAYSAADKGAAEKLRSVETLAGPVVNGVQRLKELSSNPTVRFAGSPANLEAHSIMAGLSTRMPLMAGAMVGAKRVNEPEIKAQAERFQDPTRFDQTLGGIKSDSFLKELENEVEGMRAQHLVGYKPGNSFISPSSSGGGKLPLNPTR